MDHRDNDRNRKRRATSSGMSPRAKRNATFKTVGFIDLAVSLSFALFLVRTVVLSLISQYRSLGPTEWVLMTLLVISVALLLTPPVVLIQVAYSDPWNSKGKTLLEAWMCLHWAVVPCALGWGVTCFLQEYQGLLHSVTFCMYAWFKLITLYIIHCKADARRSDVLRELRRKEKEDEKRAERERNNR